MTRVKRPVRGKRSVARRVRYVTGFGCSVAALAAGLFYTPVLAQTSAILRASAGLTTPIASPAAVLPPVAPVAPNVAGMTSASARALANQAAATNAMSMAVQANAAARATAQALAQTVPNGLIAGGLVPVANPVAAALDPTGLRTWQGASAPVQSGDAATPTVTITQTASRALLTWDSFNIGRNTVLEFKQQPDWVVVNRVVANIDPATGRIANQASLRPSQILGTIKADGTVVVINQNGILFGGTAQVNTRSFLASSLEIGAATRETQAAGSTLNITVPNSIFERSVSYLQSGLLASGTLVSAVVLPNAAGNNVIEPSDVEGDVRINSGSSINSANGGYVIIAAPKVVNAGQLSSSEGQVSLQSGRQVLASTSSGSNDSIDPEVRGLLLSSIGSSPDSISNLANGLIEARRGYISIGTTVTGEVSNAGVLNSTTSVTRNGKIAITGSRVTLATGSTVVITPDSNGETIPQSADSAAAFKRSKINIGGAEVRGTVSPSLISLASGTLIYAPSAKVNIGATNGSDTVSVLDDSLSLASSLTIASGATIDVGGIKDLVVPASRNSIQIAPAKRNELRDTPNYRETTTDGSFTLNGATLFVDPRRSGVRSDGVAWIGSPLIEAGSFVAQVGVTAAELMTTGGDLTLGVRSFGQGSNIAPAAVTVGSGAVIDVSGGWVRYEDGVVQTSRLRTADGRIVEIGNADPNDVYVAVLDSITVTQPRFGFSESFANTAQTSNFQTGYTEGRDAGSLTIKASTNSFAGVLHGDAFAGTRQIADAKEASKAATIASDRRMLQAAPSQLPSGGLLKIAAIGTNTAEQAGGADIIVYGGAVAPARPASEILLSDAFLSGAGLSQLALQTSGRVGFQKGSVLTLQAGGSLVVDAGRPISFDGLISIASGTIAARTYVVVPGSVFRTDDELPSVLGANLATPHLFDITVNGLLSTRGRWTNDYLVNNGVYLGSAYTDGGSISLEVAPRVLVPVGENAEFSADLSGSLYVNASARIDVSGGGYVRPDGSLSIDSKGGNVALINQTTYSQIIAQPTIPDGFPARSSAVDAPSFIITADAGRQSGLAPRALESRVIIAPGTITAHGFSGGGNFTLVTPDLNFGGRAEATGTALGLDFFSTSGFGSFSLTTYATRLLSNVFSNDIGGNNAVLDTEIARIGAGETLNLTQSLINSLLVDGQIEAARNLASGGDIARLLGVAVPVDAFDRKAVGISFGGLTEVDIAAGGLVTGSDGASLTATKLLNAGTIRIAGGTVSQVAILPAAFVDTQRPAIGVTDLAAVFGARDANGLFNENAANALGIRQSSAENAPIASNADLVSLGLFSRPVYFTGTLAADEGIRLTVGGVTDLSGAIIRNPRAGARPGGEQKIDGRIVNGGRLETAARFVGVGAVFADVPLFGIAPYTNPQSGTTIDLQQAGQLLNAHAGATINVRGASDRFDFETALGVFTLSPVWSDGGSLSLGSGGTIGGARVFADGGAASAEGGVLTWLDPVLRQTDAPGQAANVVSADQITAAGFDTFIAQNRLTTLGNATLTLGRGFYLMARPFDGNGASLDQYRASLATTGDLLIAAPYIRLESPQQQVFFDAFRPTAAGAVTLSGQTIDIIGSVYADASVTNLTLNAIGDVRLTGVQSPILTLIGSSNLPIASALSGQFVVAGNLNINAAQLYPTTGTGSLQQEINAQRAGTTATAAPYVVASTGANATIRVSRAGTSTPAPPYSAGGNLLIQAANIVQTGVIRVPLGRLALGANTPLTLGSSLEPEIAPATRSTIIEANSITSVSANGLNIPYGTTTDLVEYLFTPTSDGRLFAPPAAELRLSGGSVDLRSGATVDATGGGDLYAYEFAAGIGGSRDVLSRFNADPFSGNNGLQFADGRQVYAIVPSLSQAGVALVDPVYSGDYGALYNPSDAGRRVFLEAAPGLAAGWYTLLPARYALLPGGMRVVENVGEMPPALGQNAQLRDGSLIVGGRYGITGTAIESSQRRTFTVQSQGTFRKFSNIQLTQASATFSGLATRDEMAVPRLPADAARLVLAPLTALEINTRFLTSPATGGRGAQVDISGNAFEIVVPGSVASPEGSIRLTTTNFSNLNAASLLIGGIRTENSDGTTTLQVTSKSILVANDAANPLTAPEILLAVDAIGSTIRIADGAVIAATGTLNDTNLGDYIITASIDTGQTGIGGVVRLANGGERLLSRPGSLAFANSLKETSITIGEARLSGQSILLDSSRDLIINNDPLTSGRAEISATANLAVAGDDVHFTAAPSGYRGLVITPDLEAQFANAEHLLITTRSIIGFTGGTHAFKDLTIDAHGIRPYGQAITPPPKPRETQFDVAAADLTAPINVIINARALKFANSDISGSPCAGNATVTSCGSAGNILSVNATSISFGSGGIGAFGFDRNVLLSASQGVFIEGSATFDTGLADLNVISPYFGDRALSADPRGSKAQPALGVFTQGAVLLNGPGAVASAIAQAPGATLTFGSIDRPVASFTAAGIALRASAGVLDVRTTGDIVTTGNTLLATPGYARTFGDAADQVTVSAPGGTLSLVSLGGNVSLGSATTLSIGGGSGDAGTLQLSAALGGVTLPGVIDSAAPNGRASLLFDSGLRALDLAAFLTGPGKGFTGDIAIRTGTGSLTLNAGQKLRAESLRLTADGGRVDIAGTIDTSGINGGSIGLFGLAGVSLQETARLDAYANGYPADDTRAASGGRVDIGTAGTGAIIVASGARIDVAARRPGARLIAQIRKDAQTLNDSLTYNYAQSDVGGSVNFRAPVLFAEAGAQTVNVNYSGTILGASETSVEGYRIFNLAAMADPNGCANADICINANGQAVLDLNAAPLTNRLAATARGTVPDFIRNFNLGGATTGLGALLTDPSFRARPGVQLEYAGDIVLASNWNLAAATVDVTAAIADGLIAPSLQLGNGLNYVVPGKEAELFSGFSEPSQKFYTDFVYRVGGRASGEAGILTLRAGGNLDIRGSISDGFFNFADATDPTYLSFQLGGGDRQYRPALDFNCGAFMSCGFLFTAFEFVPGATAPTVPVSDGVNIVVSRLKRGQDIADLIGSPIAPYSAAANSPGALGHQANGAGDPIGSATIMPLLADGSAAASFSLRLVGGAAAPGSTTLPVSADPLAIAPVSTGSVMVSGEATYLAAPIATPQKYAGDLELFNADPIFGTSVSSAPGDFIEALAATGVVVDPNTYTRLTLTGASATIRSFFVTSARAYFAANNIPATQYQFFGPANNPTVLTASADLMARFMQSISKGFAGRIGTPGFNYAALVAEAASPLINPNIATRTLIRTGTGAIDIMAARDVDLTNGRPVFRAVNGRNTTATATFGAQVGGAAVYTVGHRVDPTTQSATTMGSTAALLVDPAFQAARTTSAGFAPNLQGVLNNEPVYASDGGDIRITSGRDVIARRDAWSEAFRRTAAGNPPAPFANAGTDTQLWRSISAPDVNQRFTPITNIRINAQLFSSGVGALGGGSVQVDAARNISELTVVSDTSVTTGTVSDPRQPTQPAALTLISYGRGNVAVRAGKDVLGTQADVASGSLTIKAGNQVASAGTLRLAGTTTSPAAPLEQNLLRVRLYDATATISAIKSVTIGGIAAMDGEGFFTRTSGVSILTNGDVLITNTGKNIRTPFSQNNDTNPNLTGALLPGSFAVSALFGDINLSDTSLLPTGARPAPIVLVPSAVGQLRLFAGGDLAPVTLVMDDGDPSLTPGPLSALTQASLLDVNTINPNTRRFGVPVILPNTSDADRRLLHNERPTHAGDAEPVRIAADGNINQLSLFVPKQARITAGGDIVDAIFVGQNLNPNDVTRITAGGDIVASSRVLATPTGSGSANLPVLQGNNFVLGGPGSFFVEAGRDLGPFFNSAIVGDGGGNFITYGGGILTVGNDYNPWLQPAGAKLYVAFGVGKGANFNALLSAYVDPNALLDGDLFVQVTDENGNTSPDTTKPIYDTALVSWLVENQPDAITSAFGAPITLASSDVVPLLNSLDPAALASFLIDLPYLPIGGGINSPTVAIDRSVATAPVLLTGVVVENAPPAQRTTISGSTLIGWLAQNAPSVLMSRYRLTNTDVNRAYAQLTALPQLTRRQFLLDRVYFNELAAPSRPDGASSGQFIRGYRAVDLVFSGASGYTKNDLVGVVNGGSKVSTGNLDLRLATLETQRGGDITILGPGGRVLGGSIVATATQASRRGANLQDPFNLFRGTRRSSIDNAAAAQILGIPTGFEGVLTLRGGSVRGFTDSDFLLNQSRLFTVGGGDITLWSSNGDLNAGQGVKTTSNNPPVVVRFDPNGFGVLDQAGAVAGAGIAGFQPAGVDKAPDVTLIAPVGTVDAGDAGVRASGNVFVAAARVANADNFKVGGASFGNIATTVVDTGAAASANAASAAASQAAAAVNPSSGRSGDDRSRISVEVLGFAGSSNDDPCNLPAGQRLGNCPVNQK